MKKQIVLITTIMLSTVPILFVVFTTNVSSMQDLCAKASQGGCYCIPSPGCDCRSDATGIIYPDHLLECDSQTDSQTN
ncbi:MAG: hypothetical protein WKF85_00065 [Chitinophagaceae bacterium]